jgi:hypothetical protein
MASRNDPLLSLSVMANVKLKSDTRLNKADFNRE